MPAKKKTITTKIPVELDEAIEEFVRVFNKSHKDSYTTKSEFICIACYKLLVEYGVIKEEVQKDKEEA